MKIATLNFHRCFLTLLVVLPLYGPLRAQESDEDGQFHLGFTGSAVFPYNPKGQSGPGGEGINFKAGAGLTAAFGYAFKEGFSTEMEWGYQKAGQRRSWTASDSPAKRRVPSSGRYSMPRISGVKTEVICVHGSKTRTAVRSDSAPA